MWVYYTVMGLMLVMLGVLVKYHSEVRRLVNGLFKNLKQSQKINEMFINEIKNIRKRIEDREDMMRKYNDWDN